MELIVISLISDDEFFAMRFIQLLFILCLTAHAAVAQTVHCLNDRYAQTALFDSAQINIVPAVHYATSVRWPGTQVDSLKMDIYMPQQGIDPVEQRPLIVMVHGGSFMAGTRQEMAYLSMEMARRGFVTATITYRLGWGCGATDALGICLACGGLDGNLRVAIYRAAQDARAAVRHLAANAQNYGIDTSMVFVQGTSAGAITAMHTAFWDQSEANSYCPSCINHVGLLDTTGNAHTFMPSIKGVVNNCGAIREVSHLSGQHDIPVVSFHDEGDCVVPFGTGQVMSCLCTPFLWVAGSNSIHNSLTSDGKCHQLNQAPGINHCWYPSNAIIPKATCFLKSIMCEDCVSNQTTSIWNTPDCTEGAFSVDVNNDLKRVVQLSIVAGHLSMKGFDGVKQIVITDMMGRTVWEASSSDDVATLPVLPSGTYVITAIDGQAQRAVLRWVPN
jgi:hypothetical protein